MQRRGRGPPQEAWPRAKVCLVGDRMVGKTALVRRYLSDAFDEAYVATLGARVHRVLALTGEDGVPAGMRWMLWDTMGDPGFRVLLQEAYFHRADGVVAVCDLTRRVTMWGLGAWLRTVRAVAGSPVVLVVGNKADLEAERVVPPAELESFALHHRLEAFEASARTGQGVREVFDTLLRRLLGADAPAPGEAVPSRETSSLER